MAAAAPRAPYELPGVALTARADTEAGWFSETDATPTFVAAIEYAANAPRDLKLITTVMDADDKVVARREETVADDEHRYRVKKATLDRLPAGEYTAQFRLSDGGREVTRNVRFSVR